MEPEFEEFYVSEAVMSIRAELSKLRVNPLPDPDHVAGLISWIRFGIQSGKFTLEDVQTNEKELHDFSRILITH